MQRKYETRKENNNAVSRMFSIVVISVIISYTTMSILAQTQTPQVNVTCVSCYQYQITYQSTVLGMQYCPAGTLCNSTSLNTTNTSPCSSLYSCANQTANSTVFNCPQTGKFASLTSCNEYNTCRLLTNGSVVLIVKQCPGRSLFNDVVKLCTLSNIRSCGNVTYFPPVQ